MVGDSGLPVAPTLVVSERRVAHGGLQAADTTEQRLRIEHNESVRAAGSRERAKVQQNLIVYEKVQGGCASSSSER